jgi:hypothetical protein
MLNTTTIPFEATLPGGGRVLAVTLRPATIAEQLVTRNKLLEGDAFGAFTAHLAACTVAVADPGRWAAAPGKDGKPPACPLDWAAVPSGLRLQAAMRLRIGSDPEGHKVDVEMIDPWARREDRVFVATVDIRPIEEGGELVWYDPEDPEAVVNAIVSGDPIPVTVGPYTVRVQPPSGAQEGRFAAAIKALGRKSLSDAELQKEIEIRAKVISIASVDGEHPNDLPTWVGDLDPSLFAELEAALDTVQWGVDLAFSVEGPSKRPVAGTVPFDALLTMRPQKPAEDLRARRRARAEERLALRQPGLGT